MIAYLVAYVVFTSSGVLLLRARLGSGESISSLATDPRLIVGVVCYAASFLTWMAALRHFELTRAFPIFIGASYAAIALGAVALLGEHLTGLRLAGVVLVGVGILLIGR